MNPNSTRHKSLSLAFAILIIIGLSVHLTAGCTTFGDSSNTKKKTTTTKGKNTGVDNNTTKADSPGTDLKDFSRYPGSKRTSYTIVKGENNKQSGTIIYETGATVPTVIKYLKDEAEKEDWTLSDIVDTKVGQILIMSKVTRRLSISVSRREKETTTDVIYVYREY